MGDRIVVIGSNSFSGSHFVDYSLDRGLEVIGMSRSAEPNSAFLPYKNKKYSGFRFYQLDLNRDLGQIIKIVSEFKPSYIVNFAGQSMVAESWQHPEHYFLTNTVAMVSLHNHLRECEFLEKYVHISTPEVYGMCEGLIQENLNYNPSTPYAVSRAATDMSLKTFFDVYNFPVVFTRAANVYGPGQQLYRIIPRAILYFLVGRRLKLHGGGVSIRSFIHIRDVADGTLRVAMKGPPGSIYHLSTTRHISIRKLVELIASQLGVSFEDNIEIIGDRLGKDAIYRLDNAKAKLELDWRDRIVLEQGIEDTIGWVRDNLEVLQRQPLSYIHKP